MPARIDNRQRVRDSKAARLWRYGLSDKKYQELLIKQHGKCATCGEGETRLGRNGRVRSLGVDHCHQSGVVRGLLCANCNNILGHAKDSPDILRRLASYLELAKRQEPDALVTKQLLAIMCDEAYKGVL